MMDQEGRIQSGGLSVDAALHCFVEQEALPGSGIEAADFWSGLEQIVQDLAPRNRELLARRDELGPDARTHVRTHQLMESLARSSIEVCAG